MRNSDDDDDDRVLSKRTLALDPHPRSGRRRGVPEGSFFLPGPDLTLAEARALQNKRYLYLDFFQPLGKSFFFSLLSFLYTIPLHLLLLHLKK